jgi:hypothetical protein
MNKYQLIKNAVVNVYDEPFVVSQLYDVANSICYFAPLDVEDVPNVSLITILADGEVIVRAPLFDDPLRQIKPVFGKIGTLAISDDGLDGLFLPTKLFTNLFYKKKGVDSPKDMHLIAHGKGAIMHELLFIILSVF